jgi:pyridoxine 5-phosphate synthase
MRLGVNIDHVATLRNARGGREPEPLIAAGLAQLGGADQITVHLREDRRHILDRDVFALKEMLELPLNLEMAPLDAMVEIALKLQVEHVTLVPEKREEKTTEGGLDLGRQPEKLREQILQLQQAGIQVSLFVEADLRVMEDSRKLGAEAVELHTGDYANARGELQMEKLKALEICSRRAFEEGLKVHAGHGLNYQNVGPVARLREIEELNIGHSIISRALFSGLEKAVKEMRMLIDSKAF